MSKNFLIYEYTMYYRVKRGRDDYITHLSKLDRLSSIEISRKGSDIIAKAAKFREGLWGDWWIKRPL